MAVLIDAQNTNQTNTPIIYTKLTKAHISYDSFKILYHFNIDYVNDISRKLSHTMKQGQSLCNQMKRDYCEVAIQQIEKNRLITEIDLKRIDGYGKKRVKRYCEMCGTFLHWSMGIMDADTAVSYDEKINELQNATLTQHQLMKNQTYIMETSLKTNTEIMERLAKAIYDTSKNEEQLSKKALETELNVRFGEIIQLATLMNSEQQEMIRSIKQTLAEAKAGKIPEIIDEEQLNRDIEKIHNGLSENQALPIDFKKEEAIKIFKYATTKATKYKTRIMIEITIPITSREKYNLFKAIGVPFKVNKFTLIPKLQSKYFLLNEDETKFITMSEKDLENGRPINENEIIYKPSAIVRMDRENICEWKILSETSTEEILKICEIRQIPDGNYVFEINQNDIYFISVNGEMRYSMTCGDQPTIKQTINENTILKVKQNCAIKTNNFLIQPHNTYVLNETQVTTPIIFNEAISETKLEQWLKRNLTAINITQPILITEFSQLHNLIEEAEQLSRATDYDLKMEEIHYDSKTTTFIWILLATGSLLILGAIAVGYLLYKIGLLRLFLGPEGSAILQTTGTIMSTTNRRIQTPHPRRKTSEEYEIPNY